MVTGGSAVCRAYATEENASLEGSRFVGPVELRCARGRVWMHGRRVPDWWLLTHKGGKVAGLLAKVALSIVSAWSGSYDWLPSGGRTPEKDIEAGDVWLTYKTKTETVSWPAAQSRLVTSVATAHADAHYGNPTLPMAMSVRGVTADKAMAALNKAGGAYWRLVLEVPLGLKGRAVRLCLEVQNDEKEAVMRVLSGQA